MRRKNILTMYPPEIFCPFKWNRSSAFLLSSSGYKVREIEKERERDLNTTIILCTMKKNYMYDKYDARSHVISFVLRLYYHRYSKESSCRVLHGCGIFFLTLLSVVFTFLRVKSRSRNPRYGSLRSYLESLQAQRNTNIHTYRSSIYTNNCIVIQAPSPSIVACNRFARIQSRVILPRFSKMSPKKKFISGNIIIFELFILCSAHETQIDFMTIDVDKETLMLTLMCYNVSIDSECLLVYRYR